MFGDYKAWLFIIGFLVIIFLGVPFVACGLELECASSVLYADEPWAMMARLMGIIFLACAWIVILF